MSLLQHRACVRLPLRAEDARQQARIGHNLHHAMIPRRPQQHEVEAEVRAEQALHL